MNAPPKNWRRRADGLTASPRPRIAAAIADRIAETVGEPVVCFRDGARLDDGWQPAFSVIGDVAKELDLDLVWRMEILAVGRVFMRFAERIGADAVPVIPVAAAGPHGAGADGPVHMAAIVAFILPVMPAFMDIVAGACGRAV